MRYSTPLLAAGDKGNFFFQITLATSEGRGARSPAEGRELPEIIPAGRERTGGVSV